MVSKNLNQLPEATAQLKKAMDAFKADESDHDLLYLALIKAFEVAVECAWKQLKIRIESEGLDAPSPKAAIKQAALLEMINEPETWLEALSARNDSIHNYFGTSEEDFVDIIIEFYAQLAKLNISQGK